MLVIVLRNKSLILPDSEYAMKMEVQYCKIAWNHHRLSGADS